MFWNKENEKSRVKFPHEMDERELDEHIERVGTEVATGAIYKSGLATVTASNYESCLNKARPIGRA